MNAWIVLLVAVGLGATQAKEIDCYGALVRLKTEPHDYHSGPKTKIKHRGNRYMDSNVYM